MQEWRNGKRTRFRIEKLGVRISLPVQSKEEDEKFILSIVEGNLSSCTEAPLAQMEEIGK